MRLVGNSTADVTPSQPRWGTEDCRRSYQIREGIRFHLLHDLTALSLDRDFADIQLSASRSSQLNSAMVPM